MLLVGSSEYRPSHVVSFCWCRMVVAAPNFSSDKWMTINDHFLLFTSIHIPFPSLPSWSNALSRYSLSLSPVLESHLAIYKIYPCWCEEHDLARIFFVMCAMVCDSSLPMNFDIVFLEMPNDWTDNTYIHSFLCLKTDLWSKNNSSNRPTFSKLLFPLLFWCCCVVHI